MPNLLLVSLLVLQTQQAAGGGAGLTATELSIGAAAALARRSFAGAELGLSRRASTDTRIAFAVAGGTIANRAAGRAQLTLQLLINPSARSGVGVYGGFGAAFVARRGSPGQGYVALLLGLEGSPGRRQGWFLEAGLAGGVRVAAGWRMRWFPAWWRAR